MSISYTPKNIAYAILIGFSPYFVGENPSIYQYLFVSLHHVIKISDKNFNYE